MTIKELRSKYHNRDLSWLSFNYRVLKEAKDKSVPLFNRLFFLSVFSSNLDEFFRVRVAALKRLIELNKKKKRVKENLLYSPSTLLKLILKEVERQQVEFGNIFRNHILPEMDGEGIHLYYNQEPSPAHMEYLKDWFPGAILPNLQPQFITSKKKAPFIENHRLYLISEIKQKAKPRSRLKRLVLIPIPTEKLPRFVSIPDPDGNHHFAFLEDVIRWNLDLIFPGFQSSSCFSFKINRDADLYIQDEFSGDLVEKIRKHLEKREIGPATRFLYDKAMPRGLLQKLMQKLSIDEDELVAGGRYHNFSDFTSFRIEGKPHLSYDPQPPVHKNLGRSIFKHIEKKDAILHFPYHSYDSIIRFFNEAAVDPAVKEIKISLYRIASESAIANTLINAARAGKKVTVFVEVKARFDEENNLQWADQMEKEGIKIIFSIPGLKVHAKIALIKKVVDKSEKLYGYIGTGNFNENTSKVYADHSLLTTDENICKDLDTIFNFLTKKKGEIKTKTLLVSQINLQEIFIKNIDREIDLAKKGKKGKIIIKVNNLEERELIDKLLEASSNGVELELIVRGICCINLQHPDAKNIRIRRIVDQYLEHARIFVFNNDGDPAVYFGSADWMNRNLFSRVEVIAPIRDEKVKKELLKIVEFQLRDNVKASWISPIMKNIPVRNNQPPFRSQVEIYKWVVGKKGKKPNTLINREAIKMEPGTSRNIVT